MPKILTVTPKEGESEAAFATRFAAQTEEFFGGDNAVEETTSAESTDVAETEPVDDEAEPSA